jgi:SAM-dependent methyltransferase/predicted  nucleic acid-binding Zn-ribbon protein
MEDLAAYYEQPTLWDRPLTQQEAERLHLVRTVWPEGVKTVLDAGCGNGALGNELAEEVEVIGIDFSREALRHFRRQKVLGSVAYLPFRNGSFDLVICADTLEHLLPDDFERCVAELARVTGRYLLVISPHDEDLEANSTKCRQCGTIFHINWHLRSFTKEQLQRLFSDCFRLCCFTFFGEKWLRQHSLVTQLQHSLAGRFLYWEDAVCPLCRVRQGDLPVSAREEKRDALLNGLEELLPLPSDARRENRCEVLLLFERQGERSENEADLPRRASAILLQPEDQQEVRAQLILRHRGTIDMASPLCASPMIHFHPERAYLLVNDLMDWGEPHLLDGRWVRNYEDRGGKDAHAAFVLPWDARAPKTLVVSYKDTTTEPAHLQVYDPKQGYVLAGTLSGEGTGRWREAVFPLPAHVRPGREGLIVHFVAEGLPHPREPHPIGSIGFLGAATQSIPLELRPMREDSKKAWVADYPQATCFSQEEPILKVDRPCLAMPVLPTGERYFLGEGEELPIPMWLHELQLGRVAHGERERLETEVATLQEALQGREIEVSQLETELADREVQVTQLQANLAEAQAVREREVATLQEALVVSRQETSAARFQLEQWAEALGQLRAELTAARAAREQEVTAWQETLRERETQVTQLQEHLAEARTAQEREMATVQKALQGWEVEAARLQGGVSGLWALAEAREQELVTVRGELEDLRRGLDMSQRALQGIGIRQIFAAKILIKKLLRR